MFVFPESPTNMGLSMGVLSTGYVRHCPWQVGKGHKQLARTIHK